ncbi:hypothetical protein [Rhodopirellula baltica]|nr:hypothetical protein [Rhodopirellula baltica]
MSDALAMAYKSRLAFFQSIGMNAMYNMAYREVANLRFTLGNNLM